MHEMMVRRFQRKMSAFLCREMLYDYVQNQLDSERRQDIERFLADHPESQADLAALTRAIHFADQLSNTQVSGAFLQHLQEAENLSLLGKRYISWKNWPDTMRWSSMAIVVSVLLAFSVAQVPWSKFAGWKRSSAPDTVELAQLPVPGQEQTQENAEAPTSVASADKDEIQAQTESSGDFEGPAPAAPPEKVVAKPIQTTSSDEGSDVAVVETAPETPSNVAIAEPKETPAQRPAAKPKSFVYRAFMSLPKLDEIAPKIAAEIKGLGGAKAGEVELGWRRGRASYYHFTLPESNEQKLLEILRGYGPVRISKDPHPRVMPEGQVRFILWVDPAN